MPWTIKIFSSTYVSVTASDGNKACRDIRISRALCSIPRDII